MSARQKQWARIARETLMDSLGRQCVHCGTTQNLTFDCIKPMGERHHRMDTSARMSFYNAQNKAGNVQVLCHFCNAKKRNSELRVITSPFVFGQVSIVEVLDDVAPF